MSALNGCYVARYEGLNPDGTAGQGVVVLRDGRIFGGDSLSFFVGTFREEGALFIADVKVFPLADAYRSITGIEDGPWDIPDIRGGVVPGDPFPGQLTIHLDAQRYGNRSAAISIDMIRVLGA